MRWRHTSSAAITIFRCYYTLFTYDQSSEETPLEKRPAADYKPMDSRIASLCYAESDDGVHWRKPSLGLVDFEGSRENNILLRYAHGTGIFLDEKEQDPRKRYKLVTKVEYDGSRQYMAVSFSEDGIHFCRPIEWPKHNPPADSHNFVLRDPRTDRFLLFTRIWKNGVRVCAKCESTDFINWSEPVEVAQGAGFANELYSMAVCPCEGLLLGLASIYHNGDTEAENYDTVDLALKFSTTGDAWETVSAGDYMLERGKGTYPSGEFDCGCIYAAAPIEWDGRLWVYYMGGNGKHTGFRETSFARGWLEKDKFAGYAPRDPKREGRLVTSHFTVYGEDLYILADVEKGGSLAVELGTKSGDVYGGFEKENCVLARQADGYWKVSFKNKSILELRTKPVSLHITFAAAKIYALKGALENHRLKY